MAAYPVMGPVDVVEDGFSGALDDDLQHAVEKALSLDADDAIAYAKRFDRRHVAVGLLDNMVPVS